MQEVLDLCFRHDTEEGQLVFRYATNLAHAMPVDPHVGEAVELTLRRLTRLVYEAGRSQGVEDVKHLLTFGEGPYR